MNYNKNKVDEVTLALLSLVSLKEKHGVVRAWKGFDWDTLDRLFKKGWIRDPKGPAKSVVLTQDGARKSTALFRAYFTSRPEDYPVRRDHYRIFQTSDGRPVRLSWARWRHIQKKHPEVSETDLRETIEHPDSSETGPAQDLFARRTEAGLVTVEVKDVHGLYIRSAHLKP
jgi:hypothetical protein